MTEQIRKGMIVTFDNKKKIDVNDNHIERKKHNLHLTIICSFFYNFD